MTISRRAPEPIKRISSATKIAPHNRKGDEAARRTPPPPDYYIRQMLKRVMERESGSGKGLQLTLKCCACSNENKIKNKHGGKYGKCSSINYTALLH